MFITILQFLIIVGVVYIGSKLGGVAIGTTAGIGLIALGLTGIPVTFSSGKIAGTDIANAKIVGNIASVIPFDVLCIILAVVTCIAIMEIAGGLDLLVLTATKIIKAHPRRINFYGPIACYLLSLLAGTGMTAFSLLPVIAEVSKEQKIRPSRSLSMSVVASQIAVTASPISAAVVAFSAIMKEKNVDYSIILLILIPSTFIAVLVGSFVSCFLGKPLEKDKVYIERLKQGKVKFLSEDGNNSEMQALIEKTKEKGPKARISVIIFLSTVVLVTIYSLITSDKLGIVKNPPLDRTSGIITFMLVAASLIVFLCKVKTIDVLESKTFHSGLNACICILGMAWLGVTFINAHMTGITNFLGNVLPGKSWLLAIFVLMGSAFLYSQAVATKTFMPIAVATAGISPIIMVACMSATCGMFLLPTYPTMVAAMDLDDTGSTRTGKFVFDHSFFIPGVLTVAVSVVVALLLGKILIK